MSKVALTLAALITAASVVSSPALAGSHINIPSVRSPALAGGHINIPTVRSPALAGIHINIPSVRLTVPPSSPPKHITRQAMGRDEVNAYIAAYKYGQWLAQTLHDNGDPPPE